MAPGGMAPADRDEVLRQVVGPGGRLGEYLAEEVFAAEPPAVPELLHRIAVVCQVTPALCDALGVGEAAGLLPDLARRGLVQFSPGPEPRWSLSPLVREFFLGRPGLSREERVVLNRRAAAFHAGRGAYGEALRHYAAAEDHPAVASLLAERGTELVDTGQVDAVLAAAELAARSDDRRVQQALGYARHVRGQWAMALDAFDRAGADQEELTPALAWRMGLIRYDRGEPAAALALYSRGRLDREDTVEEALLLCWTAAAYHLTGQYDLCRASVERAAVVAERCRDARTWASVDTVRMLLAAAVGDRAGADAWFRSALQWAEAAGDMLQGLRITVNRAGHLLDVGLLPEALREVERALRRNRTCGYLMLDARALTVRGLAAALRGELDAALHDFAAAGQIYQAIGSRFLGRSLVGVGYVHRVRADLAQARAAYEEALAQAEPAHDVQCLGAALSGLARVRAVDDPAVARTLADRAVELAVPATLVQALIAQGWVALLSGDAGAAAGNAGQAAGSARAQRDRPGLAEALELAAMATHGRQVALSQLEEAIRIWAEVGCPIEEAKTRLVAARLSGDRSAAELAEQALRSHGLRTDRPHAAGPLAVLADSAPTISIRALGAFRVVRGGEPVPAGAWRSKKARSLLKILVARRGRPVSREQLTGLLWPEEGSGMASRRLSVLLSTVRAVLGGSHQSLDEGPIVTDGDVVWLDLGRVHVDVEHFLALAGAALEAHGRGLAQATTQLIAAESHYGGDVLEDDPYQEWAGPLRDEARTMYACVLRALVQRLQELDDIDRSMRYSLLLLQCDRYEESAHLDLVRILAKNGRRGEARLRYREYVRRMTEIGVRPRPFPEAGPLQADSSDAS
jgi:DNA-binding SARP family transcriptional activator/tetratricopeptide (TPR) repeat protein